MSAGCRTINLPKWIEPAGKFDLVRLGRDRDGGYLVDSRDLSDADVLISLGVNDDWTFEKDFLDRRKVPLHAFDGTIDRRILALKSVKAVLTRKNVKHKVGAWFGYGKFFSADRYHHETMVGLEETPGFMRLRDILIRYGKGQVFLKIDIEGWEYRLLEDIIADAERICGLVIEFHDFDLHRTRIEDFIQRLPLAVAHLHYNSYSHLNDDGIPLVVEVTFSSHSPLGTGAVQLPHPLDRMSDPDHEPTTRICFTA